MRFWLIFILNSCISNAIAQLSPGARYTAIGNSSVAVKDTWAVNANPAGITAESRPVVALNYIPGLILPVLSTRAAAIVLPLNNNFIGVSFQRYGFKDYTLANTCIAIAKKMGALSLGLSGNLSQIKINGYGALKNISVSTGLQYFLNDQLLIGFYVKLPVNNINSPVKGLNDHFTVLAGIAYQPNEKVLVSYSLIKAPGHGLPVQFGIDYELLPSFSLRAGISTLPFKQYGGLGLEISQLSVNMALTKDAHLGYSPQIEVGYAF